MQSRRGFVWRKNTVRSLFAIGFAALYFSGTWYLLSKEATHLTGRQYGGNRKEF